MRFESWSQFYQESESLGANEFTLSKLNPDESLARLKVRLVAKSYSQVYGLDYVDTFSSITKMTSERIMVSSATTYHWLLHQLDIKNAFLNGILDEKLYGAPTRLCCSVRVRRRFAG